MRDSAPVWEGAISSLRRFKDDVREVAAGFECGIGLEGFNDVKEQRRDRVLRDGRGDGLALRQSRGVGAEPVVVGVCRIAFCLPGNDSLKGKRRVVRRIVDRTRNKFNAAVAEVGALDEHRRRVLGFAVVSNDARHANSMLDKHRRLRGGSDRGGSSIDRERSSSCT